MRKAHRRGGLARAGGHMMVDVIDVPLPQMLTELALSSWETIARRTALMALGQCSVAEYASMITEKLGAVQTSKLTMMTGGTAAAILEPWHTGATENAKRLRTP